MTQALTTVATQQVAELTIRDIRQYICPNATEPEALMFLRLCQAQGLNPFLREAYLIKYSANATATMVVGKDAFTRRAEEHPQFAGFRAGIIIIRNGEVTEREGAFFLPEETLVGGWAEVYRHDRQVPFRSTARLDEYNSKQGQWNKMPGTMIRKVALVQSLREGFPTAFRGLYDAAEMGVDDAALPAHAVEVPANADSVPTSARPPLASRIARQQPAVIEADYIEEAPPTSAAQRPPSGIDGMPSTPDEMLHVLNRQRLRIGWDVPTLDRYIKDSHGGRGPRQLSAVEASAVIDALGDLPAADTATA